MKNKILEVESNLEGGENFSSFETNDCIFFESQTDLVEETETLPYGPFFLSVPYEDLKNFLHKNYQGRNFTYQLVPNYQFVEAEEKLFRVSRIYNLPIQIYSPYARRAVDIRISGKTAEDSTTLEDFNFKLAENNLSEKLLLNEKFYWNLKTEIVKSSWSNKVENLFEYHFEDISDAGVFILPQTDSNYDDEIEGIKTKDEIILTAEHALPEKFEIIKILPVENKIKPEIFTKVRIRTKGDVAFVLKCLERKNFSCEFLEFGGESKKILRYSKEHKYFTSQDEELLRAKIKLPVVNIKFSGDKIFLTDYANYVLHFLEENYPEFNWAGVIDE